MTTTYNYDTPAVIVAGGGPKTQTSDFRRSIETTNHTIDTLSHKKQWKIEFLHLPSSERVWFHGFITSLSDGFNSDWVDEDVFGRMDPISIFKSTKRSIGFGWTVVASSENEARENILSINKFVQFLYPQYAQTFGLNHFVDEIQGYMKDRGVDINSARGFRIEANMRQAYQQNIGKTNHMVSPPLLRVRFANLLHNADFSQQSGVVSGGLIVKINGALQIEPDLDLGFFGTDPGMLYPKQWNLSCNFTVLHTHPLGWQNRNNKVTFSDNISRRKGHIDNNFPYGVTGIPRQ